MDNSLKQKRNHRKRGANAPLAKVETKAFLIGKELKKTPYTIPQRKGQADRQQNPTQNQNQNPE